MLIKFGEDVGFKELVIASRSQQGIIDKLFEEVEFLRKELEARNAIIRQLGELSGVPNVKSEVTPISTRGSWKHAKRELEERSRVHVGEIVEDEVKQDAS